MSHGDHQLLGIGGFQVEGAKLHHACQGYMTAGRQQQGDTPARQCAKAQSARKPAGQDGA
ncbi:MAG: hypothetical protein HPM95_18080 [Alphaproteobacteria bacterium]|nr:hypothetical protein [Alphaproteobacteria bacterium]